MSTALSWEVVLPQKGAVKLGAARPRAQVRILDDGIDDEVIFVPASVGRRLHAAQESGEANPSSRAELLWTARRLSEESAHARLEALVDRRDYSVHEAAQKLRDDGYSPKVIEPLLERAQEAGMLDDQRFAKGFIQSKVFAGWGKLKIECELKRRGVEPSGIEGWPEDFFDSDEEFERAYGLASRRRLTGKNDYQKLVRFLASRGFPLGLSTSVAKRVLEEAEAED